MILALDIESSGLPPDGVPIGSAQYPWMVSVGCVLFDMSGRDRAVFGSRVRSDGRTIQADATAVHGISTREAGRSGIPERTALSLVCNLAAEATILTGFNVEFDRNVVVSGIVRLGQEPQKLTRPGLQVLDLMRPAAAFTKIPSGHADGGYRWPRLDDALARIRNERPRQGHHDALKDAMAAKRLFLSLHHRGALDLGVAA